MKTSARNVLQGTVKNITSGMVSSEVTLEIAPGVEITAIVSKSSCESLELTPGKEAFAIVKASSVMLGIDD